MTCEFASFTKVFNSYKDDGRQKIEGRVQWNHVYDQKAFLLLQESNTGPLEQQARSDSTELRGVLFLIVILMIMIIEHI